MFTCIKIQHLFQSGIHFIGKGIEVFDSYQVDVLHHVSIHTII